MTTWRKVLLGALPQRIDNPDHRHGLLRHGVGCLLDAVVVVTSRGKLQTDWTMTAIDMDPSRRDLRKFLGLIASDHLKPYRRFNRDAVDRWSHIGSGVAHALDGATAVATLGRYHSSWSIAWMCYDRDVIEGATKLWARLK